MDFVSEPDFFVTYKAISNKLKKRFLKKPNVAEAYSDFGYLVNNLKMKGANSYAAFCCLAMARCEQSMSNTPGEINSTVEAARQFLQADTESACLNCPNVREHLNCAKFHYDYAIKLYISRDTPVLAAGLCFEIASYLELLKEYSQCLVLYQRAAELYFHMPLQVASTQVKVVEIKIYLNDHYGALKTCEEATELILEKSAFKEDGRTLFGASADLHCQFEVLSVLLLLHIRPHPLKMELSHSEALRRVQWSDEDSTRIENQMNEDLLCLMQSLVISSSSNDIEAMKYLQQELRPHFNLLQNYLLFSVIEQFQHPDGLGF